MSFNKIILVGNLTKEIELRYAQSGSAIANTSIATSRKFTVNGEKKEEVCFVNLTFFGRSGEIANQYLRKGSKILVEGRLNFDQWVDKEGQKRSKHSVIVETMQMLDTKPKEEYGQSEQQPYTPPTPTYEAPARHTDYKPAPRQEMPKNTLPEIDIDSEEIPF